LYHIFSYFKSFCDVGLMRVFFNILKHGVVLEKTLVVFD